MPWTCPCESRPPILEIEYEPGSVLPAFRAALGLTDEDWVEPADRVNSSIPDVHTEIARQARKIDRGAASINA